MPRLRYYISGHGLGHAGRSCLIIETLRARHPDIEVDIVSGAHPWFFEKTLGAGNPVRPASFDVGVIQRGSLRMEPKATLEACRELLGRRPGLIAREARSLKESRTDLVVCDIPALPMAAAAELGIPSVGISNFSWDWIYEPLFAPLGGGRDVIEALREDYGRGSLFLRLPFHGDSGAFARVEDLPLVGRRSGREPGETRKALGIPEGRRLALLSFGGFGLEGAELGGLARCKDWIFISEQRDLPELPNLRRIPPGVFRYPDLVRAADAVVTKPGYGIVSEAILGDTAVLYTGRGDFREQPLLEQALKRYCRSLKIDNARLLGGDWATSLESLMAQPAPAESLAAGGETQAADRLAGLCRGL